MAQHPTILDVGPLNSRVVVVSRDTEPEEKDVNGAELLQTLGGTRADRADSLRTIKTVRVGTVAVYNNESGCPGGTRKPYDPRRYGSREDSRGLDLDVAAAMGEVADLYEAGNDQHAAERFGAAILNVYGGWQGD